MNPQRNKKNKDWLALLPPDIRQLLISSEFSEILMNISTKYKLTGKPNSKGFIIDPKPGKLIEIVAKVLKGELPPKDFNITLQKELDISSKIVKKITEEINQQIFSKVKVSLDRFYKIKEEAPSPPKKIPKTITSEKLSTPRKLDTYREPIE